MFTKKESRIQKLLKIVNTSWMARLPDEVIGEGLLDG